MSISSKSFKQLISNLPSQQTGFEGNTPDFFNIPSKTNKTTTGFDTTPPDFFNVLIPHKKNKKTKTKVVDKNVPGLENTVKRVQNPKVSSMTQDMKIAVNAFKATGRIMKQTNAVRADRAERNQRLAEEQHLEQVYQAPAPIQHEDTRLSIGSLLLELLPDITKQLVDLTEALDEQSELFANKTYSTCKSLDQTPQEESTSTRSKFSLSSLVPKPKTLAKIGAVVGTLAPLQVLANTKQLGPTSINPVISISSIFDSANSIMSDMYTNVFGTNPAGSSAHAALAMSFFMSQGWTRQQAAGIVGNLQQESSKDLDPNAHNSIGMYGIAQWDTKRRKEFERIYGKPIYGSSFEDQLNYIQYELTKGIHKSSGVRLAQATDATTAAQIVQRYYEGAPGQDDQKRISNAQYLSGENTNDNSLLGRAESGIQQAGSYVTGTFGKLRDRIGNLFNLGGGQTGNERNLANLNPEFEKRIIGALTEYRNLTGRMPTLTSGFRYPGDQDMISSGNNPKARAGYSRHERGQALDFSSRDVADMNRLGVLQKYGLVGGVASSSRGGYVLDTVHVEMIGGVLPPPQTARQEQSFRTNDPFLKNNRSGPSKTKYVFVNVPSNSSKPSFVYKPKQKQSTNNSTGLNPGSLLRSYFF